MANARLLLAILGLVLYTSAATALEAQPNLKVAGDVDVANAGRQLQQTSPTPAPTPEPTKKADWYCFCGRRRMNEVIKTVTDTISNLATPTAPLARVENGSAGRKLLQNPAPTPEPTKKADWACFCGGRRLIELASGVAKMLLPAGSNPAVIPAPHN